MALSASLNALFYILFFNSLFFLTEIKCKVCISSCIFLHIFFVFFISLISYSFNVLCMLYSCVNVCDRAVRKHPTNAVPSSWGLCFFWGGFCFYWSVLTISLCRFTNSSCCVKYTCLHRRRTVCLLYTECCVHHFISHNVFCCL